MEVHVYCGNGSMPLAYVTGAADGSKTSESSTELLCECNVSSESCAGSHACSHLHRDRQ